METHWLKDMMNQLVDCKIDMMVTLVTLVTLVTRMSEMALLENHKLMAAVPGYTRAVAQLTHKTVVNQNYMMRELGCSLELELEHMRVMALL